MNLVRIASLAVAVLVATSFEASSVEQASQRKALVGGTLIDGFGGGPIRNSVILVDGERITAVGQVGSLGVPPAAEVISTEGMSVLPGSGTCTST